MRSNVINVPQTTEELFFFGDNWFDAEISVRCVGHEADPDVGLFSGWWEMDGFTIKLVVKCDKNTGNEIATYSDMAKLDPAFLWEIKSAVEVWINKHESQICHAASEIDQDNRDAAEEARADARAELRWDNNFANHS